VGHLRFQLRLSAADNIMGKKIETSRIVWIAEQSLYRLISNEDYKGAQVNS